MKVTNGQTNRVLLYHFVPLRQNVWLFFMFSKFQSNIPAFYASYK